MDANKTAVSATPPKKPTTTEFVILIRSKRGTIHALLNPKAGDGALATFESPEQAISQTEGLALLRDREFFVVPVE